MSWIHRNCADAETLNTARAEIATAQQELGKATKDIAAGHQYNGILQAERDRLAAELRDAKKRLQGKTGLLEERRRRAAETALGQAWVEPKEPSSGHRAQIARALMALPLDSYDVEVTCRVDIADGCAPRCVDWFVDGKWVRGVAEDVLRGRYGIAEEEIRRLQREARAAARAEQEATA